MVPANRRQLKLLARILKPHKGRSESAVGGCIIELAAGFHPDLTGRGRLSQGAIMGMRRREIDRHFDGIVEFASISEFIDTQVKRYSRRHAGAAGLLRCGAPRADVLLIDEVLAVGDLSFQQKCYDRRGVPTVGRRHRVCLTQHAGDFAVVRSGLLRPGGRPARSGTVGDMVTMRHDRAASADPQVQSNVELTPAKERTCHRAGATGHLARARSCHQAASDCESRARAAVHRADRLLVFDGNSMLDGEPPFDLRAGDHGTSGDVRANARAHAISGHLFEEAVSGLPFSWASLAPSSSPRRRELAVAELEPRYITSNSGVS